MNNPKAIVITPTTGDLKLAKAINSVKNQTYKNLKHLVVVDGEKFRGQYENNFKNEEHENLNTVFLSDNTGGGGWYGHRIYAGFGHLVNEDVVLFLDQDNWYEPDHVESLVNLIYEKNLGFTYSLRNIYDKNGEFMCQDNCENLGKWPVWNSTHYLIDTSAYAFRREFLIRVSSIWHQGYAADRIFLNSVLKYFENNIFETSGKYTLNYQLDGNPTSASPDFFTIGNQKMKEKYEGNYPWLVEN